ncbi:MAG: SGNH/GDSL hydrolase family protein [Acidobacteria bacterium]|nr:SGNH/GDSL hydrolase family protein [Acidobacteriota bacterium]
MRTSARTPAALVGLLASTLLSLSFSSCKEAPTMDPLRVSLERLRAVPQDRWEALAGRKIYFGHQSVGQNILDGLRALEADTPGIRLEVREMSDARDFDRPVFAHSAIGRNGDPHGKIEHFRSVLESGVGERADVAFFKFCYADFDASTDVEGLLAHYDRALADLRSMYPRLTILAVTVPLTNARPGLKSRVKSLLGRDGGLKAANPARNAVNAHIRKTYGADIWDLAAAESSAAGGGTVRARYEGRTIDLLNPAYTSDGGHLNEAGSRIVASDLLVRLAGLAGR